MRRLVLAVSAAMLLAGCVENQAYQGGPTYAAQPSVGQSSVGMTYASAPGYAAPAYTPGGPVLAQRGDGIRVREAAYGARGRYCDAERRLDRECNGRDRCGFRVDNNLCGDPAEGVVKELRLEFSCGRDRDSVSAREGQRVELRCDRGRAEANVSGRPSAGGPGPGGGGRDRDIRVMEAVYGAQGRECNARRPVADRCNGRRECTIRADNGLCGDPALGNPKTLVITYACRGEQRQAVAREGSVARLGC
ncbi:MAG: hypothetical protein AB7O45_07960 [Alphaproteobacteria bacterium]